MTMSLQRLHAAETRLSNWNPYFKRQTSFPRIYCRPLEHSNSVVICQIKTETHNLATLAQRRGMASRVTSWSCYKHDIDHHSICKGQASPDKRRFKTEEMKRMRGTEKTLT